MSTAPPRFYEHGEYRKEERETRNGISREYYDSEEWTSTSPPPTNRRLGPRDDFWRDRDGLYRAPFQSKSYDPNRRGNSLRRSSQANPNNITTHTIKIVDDRKREGVQSVRRVNPDDTTLHTSAYRDEREAPYYSVQGRRPPPTDPHSTYELDRHAPTSDPHTVHTYEITKQMSERNSRHSSRHDLTYGNGNYPFYPSVQELDYNDAPPPLERRSLHGSRHDLGQPTTYPTYPADLAEAIARPGSPGQVAGVGDIINTEHGFTINLDVHRFQPHEIKVMLTGDLLCVSGDRLEKSGMDQTLRRSFSRKYCIPSDIRLDSISSYLTDTGFLVISGSRRGWKETQITSHAHPYMDSNRSSFARNGNNDSMISHV